MRKLYLFPFLLLLVGCHQNKITSNAIWHPSQAALKQIFQCRQSKNNLKCTIQVMKKQGASKEAITFTRKINGRGFMKAFQVLDHEKVALIKTLELGADYSEGCYLMGHSSHLVNVLKQGSLLSSDLWLKLCRVVKTLSTDTGTIYFLNYEKKQCRACHVSGIKRVGFYFNKNNVFKGIVKTKSLV